MGNHQDLPALFFANNRARPAPSRKIKQLVSCAENGRVVFLGADAEESRSALCLALVEDSFGQTHIEPVVRGRGILEAAHDGAPETYTDPTKQLLTASDYAD